MKYTVLLLALLITSGIIAQDFQGVATYKSHRKMDLKMDGVDENSDMHKQIQAQLAKQFQKEYTLTFTKEESLYKQNESLAKPTPNTSGIRIQISEGADVMYKNIKENRYTNATEIFGKQFLIRDSLQGRQWEFVNETKNIGDYTCRKAIFKEMYRTQTITEEGGIETIERERETTAWYTMQIPVNNGPSQYYGLPGLILEINDGQLTLVCTKIVINPKEKVEIIEPKKGKKVSQEAFDKIMEKKTEEMSKQFNSRRKDGRSQTFIIGG